MWEWIVQSMGKREDNWAADPAESDRDHTCFAGSYDPNICEACAEEGERGHEGVSGDDSMRAGSVSERRSGESVGRSMYDGRAQRSGSSSLSQVRGGRDHGHEDGTSGKGTHCCLTGGRPFDCD